MEARLKTKAETLKHIEDVCVNAMWYAQPKALYHGLSLVENLPHDMKSQSEALASILIKVELFGYFWSALSKLAGSEQHVYVNAKGGETSREGVPFPAVPNIAPAANKDGTMVHLINELVRLEKEITSAKVDWGGIRRFLRKSLAG